MYNILIHFIPSLIFMVVIVVLISLNRKLSKEIKQSRETEEALRCSREELRIKTAIMEAQLNSTSDGMIIVGQNGNRSYQNRRVAEMWKILEDVQASTDTKEQLHYVMQKTKEPEEFLSLVQHMIKNKDETHVDIIELNDGTVLERYTGPVLGQDGQNYGRIWTFHDITNYKRVERLLAEEKEQLSITLRSIGDGVITTNIKGEILTINKAAVELTGWEAEEATGKPLREIFNIVKENSRKPAECPVSRVLETKATVERANYIVLISKNGSEHLIADSAAPIRNDKDEITGVVLVFRDVTEKQKLEYSMQRTQKLESLGVLAGGIAHDFNNLLNGVFGFLELAKVEAEKGNIDLVKEYLDDSLEVSKRTSALTRQLLTFAKGGEPSLKTVQLAPILKKFTQFTLSGSNIACHFKIDDNLWACECDENLIGQVIDNLVINAKQAMPDGGKITVSACNVATIENDDKSGSKENKFIKISIKDTGIGIPRDHLQKIFDPFFSSRENGNGLGLTTVHSIVKRHNGSIDVQSEPGKGSIFHVLIPASEKPIVNDAEPLTVKTEGSGTIIIMDDEDFILKVTSHMLISLGYETILTKTSLEAIESFYEAERKGKEIAAVILDLTVPGGKGGKDALPGIKEIKADIPVIAMSGYSDDPVIASPLKHGFTDAIAKPFTISQLSAVLGKWIPQGQIKTTLERIPHIK